MTKLIEFLHQNDVIYAVAMRVSGKHRDVFGKCETISEELSAELKKYNIDAKHVIGTFALDEPAGDRYSNDACTSGDLYKVEHDWVRVNGRILDITAKQFRDDVWIEIPDIIYVDHSHPLYLKYNEMCEV